MRKAETFELRKTTFGISYRWMKRLSVSIKSEAVSTVSVQHNPVSLILQLQSKAFTPEYFIHLWRKLYNWNSSQVKNCSDNPPKKADWFRSSPDISALCPNTDFQSFFPGHSSYLCGSGCELSGSHCWRISGHNMGRLSPFLLCVSKQE